MIKTVDENGDGKINYQEFRVMIGAKPNLTAQMPPGKPNKQKPGAVTSATASPAMQTATAAAAANNVAAKVGLNWSKYLDAN